MPIIHAHITAGSSAQQKNTLLRTASQAVVDSLGAPLPSVRMMLHEVAREHMVADIVQLDATIDKFLDYARPDHVTLTPINLHAVVSSCVYAVQDHRELQVAMSVPEDLNVLADEMLLLMPEGPRLYEDGVVTDESDEDRIAEIIREAALEGVRDELPHSIAVVVDDIEPREDSDIIDVYASIVVERDSQKAIIIGRKGARLRDVGTVARVGIEELLGSRVFLKLHVRVAKEWQRDPKQLGRLGF